MKEVARCGKHRLAPVLGELRLATENAMQAVSTLLGTLGWRGSIEACAEGGPARDG
jgi:hypothetical protein